MDRCPHCQNPIEGPFGIMSCPNCHAVLVIDMDGNVQLSENATDHQQATTVLPATSEGAATEILQTLPLEFSEENSQSPLFSKDSKVIVGENFSSTKSQSQFEEIVQFGNSELSEARDGIFYFNVTISGIDSKELRDTLRSAMTDKKFIWDVEPLMREIKHGSLSLKQLNSVKASVLINRLKAYPFEISWEQHEITRSEPQK